MWLRRRLLRKGGLGERAERNWQRRCSGVFAWCARLWRCAYRGILLYFKQYFLSLFPFACTVRVVKQSEQVEIAQVRCKRGLTGIAVHNTNFNKVEREKEVLALQPLGPRGFGGQSSHEDLMNRTGNRSRRSPRSESCMPKSRFHRACEQRLHRQFKRGTPPETLAASYEPLCPNLRFLLQHLRARWRLRIGRDHVSSAHCANSPL